MDGHGGAASSAYLRENLFSLLDEKIPKFGAGEGTPGAVPDGTPDGGYLAKSLKAGFDAADESLIDHIARLGEPECWSGSTCTSVLVRDDRVVAANVGDSRAVLIRKVRHTGPHTTASAW
jgi:protein phosphatase 1A